MSGSGVLLSTGADTTGVSFGDVTVDTSGSAFAASFGDRVGDRTASTRTGEVLNVSVARGDGVRAFGVDGRLASPSLLTTTPLSRGEADFALSVGRSGVLGGWLSWSSSNASSS